MKQVPYYICFNLFIWSNVSLAEAPCNDTTIPCSTEESSDSNDAQEKHINKYSKKEVDKIVRDIRKVYKSRKANLDKCETEMYGCTAQYSSSFFAPGCGFGSDNIKWYFFNDGEFNNMYSFISATSSLGCPVYNYQREFLFNDNGDLLFYFENNAEGATRVYFHSGEVIKLLRNNEYETAGPKEKTLYHPIALDLQPKIEIPREPSGLHQRNIPEDSYVP